KLESRAPISYQNPTTTTQRSIDQNYRITNNSKFQPKHQSGERANFFFPNLASNLALEQTKRSSKNTESSSAPNPPPGARNTKRSKPARTHQGRRACKTSPHLQNKQPAQSHESAGRLRNRVREGARARRTGGEGLDHAGAAAPEVAEDLLRRARGVRCPASASSTSTSATASASASASFHSWGGGRARGNGGG
ncbi:Os01g0887850, partial [Oryza sativa Japonica Group]